MTESPREGRTFYPTTDLLPALPPNLAHVLMVVEEEEAMRTVTEVVVVKEFESCL